MTAKLYRVHITADVYVVAESETPRTTPCVTETWWTMR
jgi:hypothetical protein